MSDKDKKKVKTHTTQKKYFGTVPRSEFYGFVVGYAIGLFVTGALRLQSQFQEIIFACVGLAIGYYIDKKYFQEPDEPYVEDDAASEAGTVSEIASGAEAGTVSEIASGAEAGTVSEIAAGAEAGNVSEVTAGTEAEPLMVETDAGSTAWESDTNKQ